MRNLNYILKYVELSAWAITFFIVGLFVFQILYVFYGIDGVINAEQALVRLYIALIFFVMPLAVKGARHSIKQ
ncbi:MAG: hypothetical protein ACI8R9_001931 [Paraglaciecola sp.]|jgi:hypothetical protein